MMAKAHCVVVALAAGLLCAPAAAQNRGFQLNTFEPNASGSWFFHVEHPYYSSERSLAAGFNLSYAHNVLRYAESESGFDSLTNSRSLIEHQLIGHLDVAGAIRDRVLLNFMLPIVLHERGQPAFDIAPIAGAAVSDPRLSATVRIYGQPHKNPWSAHAGLTGWVPLGAISSSLPSQSTDQGLRLRLSSVFAGLLRSLRWSAVLAFEIRSPAQLGTRLDLEGASVGSQVQLGLAAGYQLPALRLAVGPELTLATSIFPTQAFRPAYTSLELLIGAQHNIAKQVQVGLAVGLGFLSAPGTPDARLVLRIAYAPLTRDRDQDGIRDEEDACPDQKGIRSEVPSNNGCPAIPDRDCDGVADSEDECPNVPEGRRPDPHRLGCPRTDASAEQPSQTKASR